MKGTCIIQIKNNGKYMEIAQEDLFELIDAYNLGIFDVDESPTPVIRIVFGLGSPKASFVWMREPRVLKQLLGLPHFTSGQQDFV